MSSETSHYVVTAHWPGGVLKSVKCNFLGPNSSDVLIAKSRKLEIRQYGGSAGGGTGDEAGTSSFPLVVSLPIHGRITSMVPLRVPQCATSLVFLTTDQQRYAVIGYNPASQPYPLQTHASGSFSQQAQGILGRPAECAPLVTVDPLGRCLALHLYDGLITILPIHMGYIPPSSMATKGIGMLPKVLADPYHCRIEERTLLDIAFLDCPSPQTMPQLALLHQDSRGFQHLITHEVNLATRQIITPSETPMLRKARVDGGSSLLIPVPRLSAGVAAAAGARRETSSSNTGGGVLILGQRQITYVQVGVTRIVPLPSCLLLTWDNLPGSGARYLLGDELGNLHIISLQIQGQDKVTGLQLDTLGSCSIPSSVSYVQNGLVFVGSQLGDAQLVQIHDQPIVMGGGEERSPLDPSTYLSVVDEYTNLGPVVDFDLVQTASKQSQVITASGSSVSGTLRLVQNGIGMKEYATVEIPGILHMWNVRSSFISTEDAYLVQSFVGETRVLGVTKEDEMGDEDDESGGASLEEVVLSGLDASMSSLFVGNVQPGDSILQVTESEVRLISAPTLEIQTTWSPSPEDVADGGEALITIASGNEAGQLVVSLRGGKLILLEANNGELNVICKKQMEREVSCLDVNAFTEESAMEIEGRRDAVASNLVAVGLWDDLAVRLLSIEHGMNEACSAPLSSDDEDEGDSVTGSPSKRSRSNMMARSLCLVSLDSTSSTPGSSSSGVDMLFVGLGDGTLVSFAVITDGGDVSVRARKEVNLGTQQINLVQLQTEMGGTCVLATGDRPTVIYLAGVSSKTSQNLTPKLCYSNVNLSATDGEDEDTSSPPTQQSISVNVAAQFCSPQLFDDAASGIKHYSLCVSDDSDLRLGVIDDIQKLHVTTCRLGMAPRRVAHSPDGRLFAAACIESGINEGSATAMEEHNMGNCIRFLDDTTFNDVKRIDMEPHEMILSMVNAQMHVAGFSDTEEAKADEDENGLKTFLLVGTAYVLPDEDEPSRGRILLISCREGESSTARSVRVVAELQVHGGVYSMCQFHDGLALATINSKTMVIKVSSDGGGGFKLEHVGVGHHGQMLSLIVKSRAVIGEAARPDHNSSSKLIGESPAKKKKSPGGKAVEKEQLAIVGDLMRSVSLVRYYPEHEALEEIARDFNANWTTACEMLTDEIYLGAENWNNIYVLRRNVKATSEEVRCRLDTIGEFHLGEMCNKFMNGSLVMPHTSSGNKNSESSSSGGRDSKPSSLAKTRRAVVTTGSQTLFATVDGTLGSVLGIDARTAAFFSCLERAIAKVIRPVGEFPHEEFRSFNAERRVHPAHGFVDGDLVESFLDVDRGTMESVVREMNRDGRFEIESYGKNKDFDEDDNDEDAADVARSSLVVEDVLAMVEEMTMFH